MSTVQLQKQTFCMAEFGGLDPLPDFHNVSYVHSKVVWDDTLTQEDVRWMRFGRVSSILPYLSQNQYTREKKMLEKDVVVLENEHVRAEFLPWMGGRLWSLKVDGRELLNHNPVVQPCNLALRNAWCSGGVEWNVSIRGHNMLTCDDLYTELLELPDGTRGVRFYEYERIRGVVYRVEAYLPPESALLYVQVHIENPKGNGEVPMYWWSNIAVPQRAGTRVIAPAETGILSLYDAGQYRMMRSRLPMFESMDLSRPCEITKSVDVFYDIPQAQRPYITALQSNGQGLVQLSTQRQFGRKLFVWGVGEGGKNWQNWLSDGSESYIELQAGIAKTQQDHIPMPDGETWCWLEAYGNLQCDVSALNYDEAVAACNTALDKLLPQEELEKEFAQRGRLLSRSNGRIVSEASGWGALENLRREKCGLPPVSAVCRFHETLPRFEPVRLHVPQDAWKQLLLKNTFPEEQTDSYMNSPVWLDMLERLPEKNAHAWYHLGVMRNAAKDAAGAKEALRSSIALSPTPLALRALARLHLLAGENTECLTVYRQALQRFADKKEENRKRYGICFEPLKYEASICLEYAQTLLQLEMHEQLSDYLDALPEVLAQQPRFLYLRAAVCVALGRYEEAERILLAPLVIPDMREGELSLCDLWFTLYEKWHGISRAEAEERFPLPHELDFRMH